MVDSGNRFALGFIGTGGIHKLNAKALLDDLVAGFKREHRKGKVLFVFAIDRFSDTMGELLDYAVVSGFSIGLVGHEPSFQRAGVAPFLKDAEEFTVRLSVETPIVTGLVQAIAVWSDPRLILIADPAEDDIAYEALVGATEAGISTRSLLNGLDEVQLEPEEEETPMARDEDFDDEYDDEDETDEPEDDEEDLDEGDETEVDDESAEEDPDEDEEEEPVTPIRATKTTPAKKAPAAKKASATKAPARRSATPDKAPAEWTEARLIRFAERDRDGFYQLLAKKNIFPGRGKKTPILVNAYLEAIGKAPAKKAVAKKAAAPTKARQ